MKKVLLYSIKPEHLINILNGRKTIEIRKSNLPKWALEALERGEVVEAYGYCTKGKPRLYYGDLSQQYEVDNYKNAWGDEFNGFVVVKFQVSGVTKLKFGRWVNQEEWNYRGWNYEHDEMLKGTCLTNEQLNEYGDWKKLYAHHLTNIQPIEPMELREFMVWKLDAWYEMTHWIPLRHSPQSFMTCWVKGE